MFVTIAIPGDFADVDPVLSGGGGDDMPADNTESQGATNHLMCVFEGNQGKANTQSIAVVVRDLPYILTDKWPLLIGRTLKFKT